MRKKYTLEIVKQYFEEQECTLLEKEYKNANFPMAYICKCGNKSKVGFWRFRQGGRCRECANQRLREKRQHSLEYVKQYFKSHNCDLLENSYLNEHTKMEYLCSCGDKDTIAFHKFKIGQRCRQCRYKKSSNKQRLTFSHIQSYFEKHNCKLLSTYYKNTQTVLDYICSCGNRSKIQFGNFQQGQRCHKCYIKNISGKHHWNYNPNLSDEERKINAGRMRGNIYRRWRKKVFKRDAYICQKCYGKKLYLNAHHIESWSKNKQIRYKLFNGITLCRNCHNEFHRIYGRKDSKRSQLNSFL